MGRCRTTFLVISQSTILKPEHVSNSLHVALPTTKGLDNHEMVDAIHHGNLKAMYLIGEEMSIVDSNANYVGAAFEKLGFFVVQDVFFSHTCQFADVVHLPASPSLEKEVDLYQQPEPLRIQQARTRCWSRFEGSLPDWKIFTSGQIANHLSAPAGRISTRRSVMDEIASSDAALRGRELQAARRVQARCSGPSPWMGPISLSCIPGQSRFPDGKARLFPVAVGRANRFAGRPIRSAPEQTAGSSNTSTKATSPIVREGIREKTPDAFVEVSPELAEARGLQSGTRVRSISALRPGPGARTCDGLREGARSCTRPMNSFRQPGEPPYQQPCGRGDEYACL